MRPTGLGHGVYRGSIDPATREDPKLSPAAQGLVAEAPEGQGSGAQRRGVALGLPNKPHVPRTRHGGSGVTNAR